MSADMRQRYFFQGIFLNTEAAVGPAGLATGGVAIMADAKGGAASAGTGRDAGAVEIEAGPSAAPSSCTNSSARAQWSSFQWTT